MPQVPRDPLDKRANQASVETKALPVNQDTKAARETRDPPDSQETPYVEWKCLENVSFFIVSGSRW